MRTVAHSLIFRPLFRAQASASMGTLRQCLRQAEDRVVDAQAMRWPALAQSWQRDLDGIKALIEQRGG